MSINTYKFANLPPQLRKYVTDLDQWSDGGEILSAELCGDNLNLVIRPAYSLTNIKIPTKTGGSNDGEEYTNRLDRDTTIHPRRGV